jgi:hypothetical protein
VTSNIVNINAMTKKTKGKRNNKALAVVNVPATRMLVAKSPNQQRIHAAPKRSKKKGRRVLMSPAGEAFLKCAFASPDFSIDPGKGIPDAFNGLTLNIKDCMTTSLTFPSGKDTYILILPIPGYAFFIQSVNIGTLKDLTFAGRAYPTYETNFGHSGFPAQNNYTKFRYASMAAGLYPTSNSMQFSGSIQVWKADVNLSTLVSNITDPSITGSMIQRITGLENVTQVAPRDNYSSSFINGAFACSVDNGDFAWNDFICADRLINSSEDATPDPKPSDFRMLVDAESTTKNLIGLGNMKSIIMKVSTPEGAVNTALLKTWVCMELQPKTNSSLYQFAGESPRHDPVALSLYRYVANSLPTAVTCAENASAWDKVKRIVSGALTVGSLAVPGVGGMALAGAAGVWNLSTGIADLFI